MSLDPLLNEGPTIVFHALAALIAFALGAIQLAGPKGTAVHRILGWCWIVLLASVAASSFWIHELRLVGPFSPIHLFSVLTLVLLPLGVLHARRKRAAAHGKTMKGLFFGALVVAGLFMLVPGRVMYTVLFGS